MRLRQDIRVTDMSSIEFQTIAHDGVVEIPPEHQRALNGRKVRVVLVDVVQDERGDGETLFARLRRLHVDGPQDLSANHDHYAAGQPDD